MSENSWQENELESLAALLSDLPEEPNGSKEPDTFRGFQGRRKKAAIVFAAIWSGTIALHLVTWGYWFVLGVTTLMSIHAMRLMLARPAAFAKPLEDDDLFPTVSLMVAAKNEEAVIGRLVKMLCELNYPRDRYEVWVIDDNSTDKTPEVLDHLTTQYPQLKVFNRPENSSGGKSGALNQVFPLTSGEFLVVFDADAQVEPDFLRRVIPVFERGDIGAIQVRKAIIQAEPQFHSNEAENFWIQGQMAEMALDAFIQQQRAAIGGLGELRGNGQLVRREALLDCGGWNEETITDDLDLTFRLHLSGWDIEVVTEPAVYEEGVTNAIALWHQRNRWAEGGYQRYLDYWRLILRNRMGSRKTIDLAMFWMLQYVMPTAAIPDFLMAVLRHRMMLTSPISAMTLFLFLFSAIGGLRRVQKLKSQDDISILTQIFQGLRGAVYMLHWFVIVSTATLRMSIRQKRLKWVKTVHHGAAN
ncbi:family 2 glycosyl transferase [Leptolyngbya boryana NIES-2135]|jgi:1,2-diacylglycerol 3-beta-glucosyltransferase|uniref:Beta-monoglucosyldiacylglycerol synthase n=1 Tax=Leptolyngbya boryana NIES-2135 TaxID=1973484 RepID=A0A1Z4JC43_LEPBY|nr:MULTISPECIES: glycosyltransferase family 2 protein [Leptolyngbya]BAY54344.1 family 2 glycosyl transferase [Leptolyngbya boryana NIES-2135]MBD2370147.1 glycosyltransferase family 2 protein [Leptolyngbya sp. FACHB-161]MBD2376386.1 glycosyltransferase family 2 protein [Leptolyngbya sp. FACHB-238]MBD2400660.1 glycosyltransferase family 2 protein [Leptolyngbya sp. FACHB-239]MBD2407203.1 glycosyltransferase family 2 protein [Leptolyngbya sp. FACHB-402]